MSLRQYRAKRHAGKTPEPGVASSTASKTRSRGKLSFVIQKHDASHLHYDFRLEMDGVLKSWAVPKGPSLDPSDKPLAVQVEDHPVEYGKFEGTIPQGQYGGGTVLLWDRGTWELVNKDELPLAAWKAGKIKFILHGEKLQGAWMLIRMGWRGSGDKPQWLLIKEKDDFAKPQAKFDVRVKKPLSVASGRDLDEIAGDTKGKEWTSKGSRKRRETPETSKTTRRKTSKKTKVSHRRTPALAGPELDISSLAGAVEAPMPRSLRPQLATLATSMPEGTGWFEEVKFDGYRLLAFINDGEVRLITRNQKDWTDRFTEIAEAIAERIEGTGILDGEVVAVDEKGISHFQDLQKALIQSSSRNLRYFVFDVPWWNGYDLTRCTLRDRYAVLESILSDGSSNRVMLSEHIETAGDMTLDKACEIGLEGLICKRADSFYEPGVRSDSWRKVKCSLRQEFVIGGFTNPRRSRIGFGSLLLGYYAGEKLYYAGNVGTGFDDALLTSMHKQLAKLERETPPFEPPAVVDADYRRAHWVEPKLVGEVTFTEWTGDGRLRHPVFNGLRLDKTAKSVVRETTRPSLTKDVDTMAKSAKKASSRSQTPAPAKKVRSSSATKEKAGDSVVRGVRISHPDRVVYPDTEFTKLDVAQYYDKIMEWMMPHLKDRPLSVVRCTSGITGECFFQKHMDITDLKGLDTVSIRESEGPADYIVVKKPEGLVSLVQMNVLEFHAWGSRADDVELADRLVIDLDPGEGVAWKQLVAAARRVREILAALKLQSFVKTTGGKGLHVVLPIRRGPDWDRVKAFCHEIAIVMSQTEPDLYLSKMSKAQRKGKVFVDYLRNGRGATAILPFSTRARPGGMVSMTLDWNDLDKISPGDFTIGTAPKILAARKKDPWKDLNSLKQSLPKATGNIPHEPEIE